MQREFDPASESGEELWIFPVATLAVTAVLFLKRVRTTSPEAAIAALPLTTYGRKEIQASLLTGTRSRSSGTAMIKRTMIFTSASTPRPQ